MVTRTENESFDSMMKRFKADTEKSGILVELKKRMYYIPPSEKRRIKHENAVNRQRAAERKKNRYYGED